MATLSEKEKGINYETLMHIMRVRDYIDVFVKELLDRGKNHDASKMESPELEVFVEHTSKLAELTYGSEEYNRHKAEMGVALEHHYANNAHHPEFWKCGINDMTLIDLVEMFCDWKAASKRHNNGNINKSIEINGERFNMCPQLVEIFENTVSILED